MAKATKTLRKSTFRLVNSDARQVLLAGDFTDWQKGAIPMKSSGNGLWTATVSLSPGAHSYLFIVDGEWCEDPECGLSIANPYGGSNMVRQVP
jgi:1,4-alpha-glucan branching enzyme